MDRQRLFLERYWQLNEKVSSTKEIDYLDVANLVYNLLLDRNKALADLANTKNIPIEFTFSDPKQPYSDLLKIATTAYSLDGFYPPDRVCETTIVTTDREAFFDTPLVKHQGSEYTVAELIRFLTEVAGARHAGEARGDVQVRLASIVDTFGSFPVLTRQVAAIGKVVRDALRPLASDLSTDSDMSDNSESSSHLARLTPEGLETVPGTRVKIDESGRITFSGTKGLTLTGHRATVSAMNALASAKVDYAEALEAIVKLSNHERKALVDKSIKPAELSIPKPDSYTDDQHTALCATFAGSISADRQAKWTRGLTIAGMVVALIVAVVK